MAWTAPITWTTNQTVTSAQMNGQIRDNMLETAPAKATTAGSHFAVHGTNSIAQRTAAQDLVSTSQSTASTSYTDLLTVGPTVTVTISGSAFIMLYCDMSNSGANPTKMGYEVSGASTVAAADNQCMAHGEAGSFNYGATFLRTSASLNPGSNTFRAKYRVAAGTGTWIDRRIAVLPF